MRVAAAADKVRPRRENEVACHSLPHEMEVVAVAPHVLTRARDQIRLPLRVVRRGSEMRGVADVPLRVEDADGRLGAEGGAE